MVFCPVFTPFKLKKRWDCHRFIYVTGLYDLFNDVSLRGEILGLSFDYKLSNSAEFRFPAPYTSSSLSCLLNPYL